MNEKRASEDKAKGKPNREKKSSSANHKKSHKEHKKTAKDSARDPGVSKIKSVQKYDSPRSNGTDIQTDQQSLEDTYDIPLDMPQRMSSQLDLEPINTINFDGNEKEFVQQQQLWLLNGRISPQNIDRILTTPQTRTTGEDVTRETKDHTIFESFPNEIQSNIYMEVDSSEQFKS